MDRFDEYNTAERQERIRRHREAQTRAADTGKVIPDLMSLSPTSQHAEITKRYQKFFFYCNNNVEKVCGDCAASFAFLAQKLEELKQCRSDLEEFRNHLRQMIAEQQEFAGLPLAEEAADHARETGHARETDHARETGQASENCVASSTHAAIQGLQALIASNNQYATRIAQSDAVCFRAFCQLNEYLHLLARVMNGFRDRLPAGELQSAVASQGCFESQLQRHVRQMEEYAQAHRNLYLKFRRANESDYLNPSNKLRDIKSVLSFQFPFLPLSQFIWLILRDVVIYYFSDSAVFSQFAYMIKHLVQKYKSTEENHQVMHDHINVIKDQSYASCAQLVRAIADSIKQFHHVLYLQSSTLYNHLISANPLLAAQVTFSPERRAQTRDCRTPLQISRTPFEGASRLKSGGFSRGSSYGNPASEGKANAGSQIPEPVDISAIQKSKYRTEATCESEDEDEDNRDNQDTTAQYIKMIDEQLRGGKASRIPDLIKQKRKQVLKSLPKIHSTQNFQTNQLTLNSISNQIHGMLKLYQANDRARKLRNQSFKRLLGPAQQADPQPQKSEAASPPTQLHKEDLQCYKEKYCVKTIKNKIRFELCRPRYHNQQDRQKQ